VKRTSLIIAWISYAAVLGALWLVILRHPALSASLGGALPYAFASGALLLAPLWFFGFGAGEWLKAAVHSRLLRIFLPGTLGAAYLVFAVPASVFRWQVAVVIFSLPVLLAAFLELPRLPPKMTWRDAVVLLLLAVIYMLRWIDAAWPYASLAALPKLFLVDLALYLFIVIRKLEGIGYCLRLSRDIMLTGLREWLYFLPFGVGLGLALGFIHFYPRLPSAVAILTSVLVTMLLVAIPEEIYFRGILQNLLESRLGRRTALIVASLLFGLAHFNKGARFNWRYVLLAAIAGIFYGRAWRARRQLLASVITHTAVDVAWSLWFR
jgi:uncharacterized protein